MNLNQITSDYLITNSRNRETLTEFIEAAGLTHYTFAPFYWGSANMHTAAAVHKFNEFARELKHHFPQVSFVGFLDKITDASLNRQALNTTCFHLVFKLDSSIPIDLFYSRMRDAWAKQSDCFKGSIELLEGSAAEIARECLEQLQRRPFAGFEAIVLDHVRIPTTAQAAA
ncbi:MAG: hypothetical protein H6998_00075 [Hahellaceae bacterium]|nr:hypothetical protein [Hahellaceae bacterium]